MHTLARGILILALAVGCSPRATTPDSVTATLAAVGGLGLRCGEGVEDNVPSGLVQWSCRGAIDGVDASVLIDGSRDGVVGLTLVVEGSADPDVARSRFGRIVDSVPPLTGAPVLKDALAEWAGPQRISTIGGVRVVAECDSTQCVVGVAPEVDALQPLPLP